MQLLRKMVFRSITEKPFRTVIIVLCLAAVSLTFSLCLTISSASQETVEEQIRSTMGRADITMYSTEGFKELPVMPEGADCLPVILGHSYLQQHDIKNYKYVQKKNIFILGTDTVKAADFGFLPECKAPEPEEAVISYALSRRFRYDVGDEIRLPCVDGTDITLRVSGIVLNKNDLSVMQLAAIVAPETAEKVLSSPGISATTIYVDAPDGKETETAEQLRGEYPEYTVEQITGTPELRDSIRSMTRAFFILFAVTLLMIVFIISAFSKNIAAERLAVIGTLRSTGAEKSKAAMILLAECAVYGVLGGITGTVLFYALKDFLLGNMLPRTEGIGGTVHAPFYVSFTGLILPALISCIVSLLNVLRSSQMSVRDIIFGGRDSVYRPSFISAVTGAALLCSSVMMYFLNCGFILSLFGLAAFVVGICLVLPKLLSAISSFTARHTRGRRFPVLRLALIQSGTKKTAIAGTVICTAAVMMTASLYILFRSAGELYSVRNYDCDAIITGLSERAERYDTITADSREFIYSTSETAEINGNTARMTIFGYTDFEMFSGLRDLPESLSDEKITLDRRMMKRLGIKEGDRVTLTLKNDTVRPVTLTLTAVQGIDSIYIDQQCNAAVIGMGAYRKVYHDYPSALLVKGDTELMKRQLMDRSAEFETAEAYYARIDEETESITWLLNALAVMGVLLAVISVSGQQMTGFEQRRHELAVLRSQGMSHGQLSAMLAAGTAVTVTVPAVLYLGTGWFVMLLIKRTLSSLDMDIPVSCDLRGIIMFTAAVMISVLASVLLPVSLLRRMNTAAELKCE